MPAIRFSCIQVAMLFAATTASGQQMNDFGMPVPNNIERKWPNIDAMPPAESDGLSGGVLQKLGTLGDEFGPAPKFSSPKYNFWPNPSCADDIASKHVDTDTLEFCNATGAAVVLSVEIGATRLSVSLPPGQSSDIATPESSALVASVGSPQNRYAVQKGHLYTIEKTNDQLVVNSL